MKLCDDFLFLLVAHHEKQLLNSQGCKLHLMVRASEQNKGKLNFRDILLLSFKHSNIGQQRSGRCGSSKKEQDTCVHQRDT